MQSTHRRQSALFLSILITIACKLSLNQAASFDDGSIDAATAARELKKFGSIIKDSNGDVVDKTYGVIVDCGSSGSRVHIYQWDNSLDYSELLHDVEPLRHPNGTRVDYKLEKPLSDLDNEPERVPEYFEQLMDFVSDYIPPERQPYTGIYVMATAGMRLLSDEDQDTIMDRAREFIEDSYDFALVRTYVITGAQEGMYQWISVNSKEKRFLGPDTDTKTKTFAIVEMGGASIQVAYLLRPGFKDFVMHMLKSKRAKEAYEGQIISPQMSRDTQIEYNYVLHSTTFLGFGSNSARDLMNDLLIKKNQRWHSLSNWSRKFVRTILQKGPEKQAAHNNMTIYDPCLPKGYTSEWFEKPKRMLSNDKQTIGYLLEDKEPFFGVQLVGAGNYVKCKQNVVKLLDLSRKERLNCKPDEPNKECTMNLIGQPFIPFKAGVNIEFRAIGDFYHTTNVMLHAAGQYDHDLVVSKTKDICNKSKYQLEKEFHDIATAEKEVIRSRIWSECFKAVWVDTFLTKAIGMPKDYQHLKTVLKIGKNGLDEPEWPLGAVLDKSLAIEKAAEDGLGGANGEGDVENRKKLNPDSRSSSRRSQ